MTSSVPGVAARPSIIFIVGRKRIESSVIPRIWTFATPPSVPFLSSRTTATISPIASWRPFGKAATPGVVAMIGILACSIPLSSSALDPFRRTTATLGSEAWCIALWIPFESIRTAAKTNTTSASPRAAAIVVVFRTRRLRRL
jgi:hypothetical protein